MDHDAIGYSYVETHSSYSIPLNYYKVESDEAKSCEFLTGGIFQMNNQTACDEILSSNIRRFDYRYC